MKLFSILSCVAAPLLAIVFLVVRETTRPMAERVGQEQVAPAPTVQQPLPTATLALAFGYSAPIGQAAGQAELVLKACFIPSLGHPRALVASREGESLYQVGDRMPGGSVLRRIDVRSITLWDGERERTLALSGSRANVFVQSGSTPVRGPASADSPRLLREVQ